MWLNDVEVDHSRQQLMKRSSYKYQYRCYRDFSFHTLLISMSIMLELYLNCYHLQALDVHIYMITENRFGPAAVAFVNANSKLSYCVSISNMSVI